MNAQNLLQNPFAELSTSFPVTGADRNRSSSIRSRNDSGFKEFFQKEINKTQPAVKRDLAYSKKDIRMKQSLHETGQLNSYKEITGNVKKTSAKKTTFHDVIANDDLYVKESEEVVKIEKKALADLLGLTDFQLTALLDYLGLNFEKPLDSVQMDALYDALSDFAGLTLQQSDVLKAALETIARRLNPVDENTAAHGSFEVQETQGQSNRAIFIKQLEIALPKDNGKTVSLEEISQQIKMRMLKLTDEFTKDPDTFVDQLNQELELLIKEEPMQKETAQNDAFSGKAEGSVSNSPGMAEDNALKNVIASEKENQNADENMTQKESRSHQRTEGKFAESDNLKQYRPLEEKSSDAVISEEPEDNMLQLKGTDILQGSMFSNSDIRIDRTFSEVVLGNAAPLQEKEILYQVIEKARVVLDGDKSEMIMDLKPDSLGKLTMKIITENGIVTAKLVAESQEVKQIIESNFNLLKDSLEKQGMNIQEFSVSVSDQNPEREDGRKRFERETGRRRVQSLSNSVVSVGPGMEEINHRLASYYSSMSTINLTA